MQPIRVAFVGAGANCAKHHIPKIAAIEGVTLQSVCNRSEESSKRVANEHGFARFDRNWKEMVHADDVDAVVCGTWPYLHKDVVLECLSAGKHILTEARLAMNYQEAVIMETAAKAHPELVKQVVPSPMTLEYDAAITGLIAELGTVRHVSIEWEDAGSVNAEAPLTWRLDDRLSGHNVMMLGILHESLLRWFPHFDVRSVVASGSVYTKQRLDSEQQQLQDVNVPERLVIDGRFQYKPQDEVLSSTLSYHLNSVSHRKVPFGRYTVFGTAGELVFELPSRQLYQRCADTEFELKPVASVTAGVGWRVEEDFVDSIRTGSPVARTSFEAGVEYMKFTTMVHDARVSGRQVMAEDVQNSV